MFTPIFSQILDSSLMEEDLETRWLFLTMLLLADEARTGVVDMPIERLAVRASLSVSQTKRALEKLQRPDPDSRSEEEEGRRIIPMPRAEGFGERGWILVNWEKYRDDIRRATRREAIKLAVREHRAKLKAGVNTGKQVQSSVSKGNPSDPDPNAYTDPKESTGTAPPPASPTLALPKRKNGFQKPTLAEVRAFIGEKGLDVDAVKWFSHYEANGWRVGRNPMKNWKAAIWTWARTSL